MFTATEYVAFGVALAGSLGLTVPVRRLALRIGLVDRPGPRKVHQTPIPLLGGLAIYAGFVVAALVTVGEGARGQMFAILAAATLLALAGILDDRGLLHHQIKLFVAMPVAGLILLASGIRAEVFSNFLAAPLAGWLDAALTLLWVVGVTAAFSILDHMDGLCAGTAAIAALFFAVLAASGGQILVSTLAAAVFGAALGFLRWNFTPAKIFMGDGGAMFLGFMMATLALKLRLPALSDSISWTVPLLVLGVPILDTTLISISRSRRGLIPFTTPGKDHAAHRLANLGLGQRGAVLVLYSAGVIFGLLAIVAVQLADGRALLLAGGSALAVLAAIAALERAPYERQTKQPRPA
jgi:UDP-GlcNAc:undecaprenyl-phosphate/decaprenyl-phosphate GlcNAc-1-phosphate transferase